LDDEASDQTQPNHDERWKSGFVSEISEGRLRDHWESLETKVHLHFCKRDFTEAVDELGKETRTLGKKQGTAFVFLFVADEGDELLASEWRKFMQIEPVA
jgi:hypothetical protein